ncbi:MFS transporter [Mastigocoleus testarum]|uniref:MFS transporter n=1 Tax=Mastigocoleus testarum BC008 TaxID=371196 RepID=A0A0V7ZV34_9CYAN|nr:MFS transporter [Mastigocoleus testarum]KST68500.1 MFS transporter [Mastigocoleus testarum BC008]
MSLHGKNKTVSNVFLLTIIFLLIELLDEMIDGVRGAAWPLIRNDLQLDYIQVGMLLTIPNIVSSIIEPLAGIWGDIGQRRKLILGGGVAFATALLLISLSHNFPLLLVGFILFYPASGCFVSLSQATLMDIEPTNHEQNMARWEFAGSVGNVIGPLILAVAVALNQSWRSAFFLLAVLTVCLLGIVWKHRRAFATISAHSDQATQDLRKGVINAFNALKKPKVVLWLILLQFSDLMLDILGGFLALYFVDSVGANNTQASFAVAVWLGFGLLGDFLLIPLLERIRGLSYLRLSAAIVLCLYPAFLLIPNINVKLLILGLLGLFNAGWYSILQGQLYKVMPGQSGTVMTLNNLFGLVGGLIPLGLGLVAQHYGLQNTMWLLFVAPVTLLIGVRVSKNLP